MKKGVKLIDNSANEYQLGSVLRELITDTEYSEISIATGYWDLPGMVEIYDELSTFLTRENTTLRILLGEEPSVKAYQVKNPAKQDPDFPEKYLKKDLEDLQLKEDFQKVADLLGKYMNEENNGKLQKFPKSYPDNLEYEVPNQFKSQLLKMAEQNKELIRAFNYEITSLAELEYLAHPLDLFEHYTEREKPINSSLEIIYTALLSLGFPCYRYNIYRHAYFGRRRGELELNADENRELSRQIGIYGIFRTVFLKRLESSLFSINKSIKSYKDDDNYTHLAHIIDDKNEAGYFIAYKDKKGEMITTAEGLLSIQSGSTNNQRFKDTFKNKPEVESDIQDYILSYQFREGDSANNYNKGQEAAIAYIRNAMFEYQYPYDVIEQVDNCLLYSLNAYLNKESMKLVRQVNRMLLQNKHVGSEIIDRFIALAQQYKPGETTDKAPLSEIIQIFE